LVRVGYGNVRALRNNFIRELHPVDGRTPDHVQRAEETAAQLAAAEFRILSMGLSFATIIYATAE
jgi:hypothetical protein